MAKMTDDELKAFIINKLEATLNDDGNELSEIRQESYDYYMGKPYGDEREGYSQFVTREVFEAVEWALPSILRAFTAGDRVVAFSPMGPNDEDEADQETDVINHYIFNEADGFLVFYEAFKDALTQPNAYLKIYVEEEEETKTEEYHGINLYGLLQLSEEEGVEIVEGASYVQQTELGPMDVFDVRLKRTCKRPKIRIECVAPENVLIDSQWTSINLDKCPFICHEEQLSKSELIERGYRESDLDGLGSANELNWRSETVNRMDSGDETLGQIDAEGMEKFWVREICLFVDFNGDGIAERRRVVMIQNEIFDNDEYDYQPFVSLATMVNSHRHVGYSLAESVKDIQRLSSQFMRLILDNATRLNIQRKYVSESALVDGGATLDALEDNLSEIIPVKRSGEIFPEEPNQVINQLVPLVASFGDMKKTRTGISPELSLDPAVLRDSTYGAFMNALENASQRIELIIRLMAETGVKWAMIKIHRLMREHMNIAKTIRIRGKWVNVNPGGWRERCNVDIAVGLGYNSRDKTIAAVSKILETQQAVGQSGIVQMPYQNVYSALSELVRAFGFKAPEKFFPSPDTAQPVQQGPSPDQQAVMDQIQVQMEAVRTQQAAVENDRARVQLEARQQAITMQEKQLELDRKQQELDQKAAKLATDSTKMMADIQQGWERIHQQWAEIELRYGQDLNQPGIGQ